MDLINTYQERNKDHDISPVQKHDKVREEKKRQKNRGGVGREGGREGWGRGKEGKRSERVCLCVKREGGEKQQFEIFYPWEAC